MGGKLVLTQAAFVLTVLKLSATHTSSRARTLASARNAASSGGVRPRHSAPTATGGISASGKARTLGESVLCGTATVKPMPNPVATYVSIKSTELASMDGNQSTPRLASQA